MCKCIAMYKLAHKQAHKATVEYMSGHFQEPVINTRTDAKKYLSASLTSLLWSPFYTPSTSRTAQVCHLNELTIGQPWDQASVYNRG